MKCRRCNNDLDESKAWDVPTPDWIDVRAVPCYECKTVTMVVPTLDLAQFIRAAKEHFGFS